MQDCTKPPAPYYNPLFRDFCGIFTPHSIMTLIIHYIYDIMLIRPAEQEAAATLFFWVGHRHERGRERNLTKIQEIVTSVEFLAEQYCLRHLEIFFPK